MEGYIGGWMVGFGLVLGGKLWKNEKNFNFMFSCFLFVSKVKSKKVLFCVLNNFSFCGN